MGLLLVSIGICWGALAGLLGAPAGAESIPRERFSGLDTSLHHPRASPQLRTEEEEIIGEKRNIQGRGGSALLDSLAGEEQTSTSCCGDTHESSVQAKEEKHADSDIPVFDATGIPREEKQEARGNAAERGREWKERRRLGEKSGAFSWFQMVGSVATFEEAISKNLGRIEEQEEEAEEGDSEHTVCWSSETTQSNLHVLNSSSASGIFMFHGAGCERCNAGDMCSFSLSIQNLNEWLPDLSLEIKDLIVLIEGPSRAIADVREEPPLNGLMYTVLYQIWDPGMYRVSVQSPCAALEWNKNISQLRGKEVASWNLEIVASTWKTDPSAPIPFLLSPQDFRPCKASAIHSRWLLSEDGSYKWVPYPCATSYPINEWIAHLNRAGIQEISFVGNTLQGMLMLHLIYLLSGSILEEPVKPSLSVTIQSTGGLNLRLNLYILQYAYAAKTTYNCRMLSHNTSEETWPKVSLTSDVIFMESGYFTGPECEQPEAAFTSNLPVFLLWVDDMVKEIKGNRNQRGPRLVYRSPPSRIVYRNGCKSGLKYSRYVNKVAKGLCSTDQIAYFDSVESIDGLGIFETCDGTSYSCYHDHPVSLKSLDAMAKEFIHFLLRDTWSQRQ